MSLSPATPTLLIFGAGSLGTAVAKEAKARGWDVHATSRREAHRQALTADGIQAVDPADEEALARAASKASHILVTAPPDSQGCPALAALSHLRAAEAWPDWIGYISSTSVYGDRRGGWVTEDDALNAATLEGARRVRAERDWLDSGRGMGLTVQIFRLPGFYGAGSNILERLKDGRAKLVRKPGQVFNRIHIDDIVSGLFASMERPRPGGIYNLTDDEPSPADVVTEWAARRLGLPQPPEVDLDDPSVSDGMRRFYLDSKRVSNARAKAELGWRPLYPSYREGLESLIPTLE
ncbi:SDR family oxidoreductase [uncultured Brevundimonas sp.]|uniref:SDR family oxidoreductase n=1 Tax=uncultured Brevundimonas sp. TaxID=213418 RepID=UPI00261DE141|nr:SDR family oxidoreductase [uncultured Brevundimonas sp.]